MTTILHKYKNPKELFCHHPSKNNKIIILEQYEYITWYEFRRNLYKLSIDKKNNLIDLISKSSGIYLLTLYRNMNLNSITVLDHDLLKADLIEILRYDYP